ncbi:hypothetical protein ACWGLP_06495 [Streptomyces lydicus]|uniref:hypothetical protein n=1 Tax=Streptomyces lydicus TaxID=47763 RepID=UPI0037D3B429
MTTSTSSTQETPTSTIPDRSAVVYICIRRSTPANTADAAAEERAAEEARSYADRHGLTIVRTITDPYGEVDPMQRPGWQRLRRVAEVGEFHTVLVRWTAAISPVCKYVSAAAKDLADLGMQIACTWGTSASALEMK